MFGGGPRLFRPRFGSIGGFRTLELGLLSLLMDFSSGLGSLGPIFILLVFSFANYALLKSVGGFCRISLFLRVCFIVSVFQFISFMSSREPSGFVLEISLLLDQAGPSCSNW